MLQPRHQLEVEHVGEGEPDDAGAVGVGVLPVHLHVGAVPQHALDHRGASDRGLYDVLRALTPSPVVALKRAVAVAMRDGP